MRRLRRIVPQAVEAARVERAARAAYGGARVATLRRMRRLRAGGFTYAEALRAGLLDPAVTDEACGRYLSQHARERRLNLLNPVSLGDPTRDKLTVALRCEAVGIPVPRTFGTIGRDRVWDREPPRFEPPRTGFPRMVADRLPDEFVVKPLHGYLGEGVRVLRKEGVALRDAAGRLLSADDLLDELLADPDFDLFLVQERLRNHPALDAVYPSPVLQTVRVTTLVTRDGDVRVLFVLMKLATGARANGVDNFHGGDTGNALAAVDPDTGALAVPHVARPDGLGLRPAPDVCGHPVAGMRLPLYDAARDLVLRAAPLFLPLRSLGWDVGLTPDGPVLIEVNGYWGTAHEPLSREAWDLFTHG